MISRHDISKVAFPQHRKHTIQIYSQFKCTNVNARTKEKSRRKFLKNREKHMDESTRKSRLDQTGRGERLGLISVSLFPLEWLQRRAEEYVALMNLKLRAIRAPCW